MLHVGVLPHHDRWGDVLSNLAYVVVDEAHVYRGVFGSHVANVLRRLRRLARVYGSEPQFLFASATIANPGELAQLLAGEEAAVVDDDGAPRAERTIALWNPLAARRGARAARLARWARPRGSWPGSCPAACARSASRSRAAPRSSCTASPPTGWIPRSRAARAVPRRLHARPAARDRAPPRRGRSARRLRHRRARARDRHRRARRRASPSASPGTVASLRQQWGRAGRRGHGLAILIASEDALDQYFMRDPEALLSRNVEAARLDHANPRVLDGHVLSAAFEAPIDDADRATLGDAALERAAALPELQHTPRRLGLGREATTRPRACRCARRRPTRSPSSTRRQGRSSGSSSASARTRRCTRARSTCTSASRTSCTSSTTPRARPSSRRSPATGTRWRRRRRTPRSSPRRGSSDASASSSRSARSR